MQENKKLRQKQRSSKGKHTRVKVRPNMVKSTIIDTMEEIRLFIRRRAIKLFSASQNRDRHKRSPWLVEQLRFKAELKRKRILSRNFRVEVLKQRNYNGV